MNTHEQENNMEIEAKWFELAEARQSLLTGEALKEVGHEIFSHKKECACCMDERVGNREVLGGEKMGGRWNVAGSGILLPEKSWKERAKVAAKEAFARGVTKLSYHDGCGAAGLAVKQDLEQFSPEERKQFEVKPDLYGQRFVELAQEELNKLNGQKESAIHVTDKEVLPFEYHAAIGATIDTTGEFNAYRLGEKHPLKYTFNIDTSSGETVQGKDANYFLNELVVAIRIATGHHGFGHKFSKENPFAVVVVADNEEEIKKREAQINDFISKNEPGALEIIKFISLIKPEHRKHPKHEEEPVDEIRVE